MPIENIPVDVGTILLITLAIVGKGMFESTVIQFGTDQILKLHQINSVHSYTGTIGVYILVMSVLILSLLEYWFI